VQEDSEPGDVDEEDALNVEPASAELPHVDSTLQSYTDSTHTRTSVRDSLRRVRFPRSSFAESDMRARVPDAPTSGPRTSRGPLTPPRDPRVSGAPTSGPRTSRGPVTPPRDPRVPGAPTSGPRTSRGPVTPPRDSSPDSTILSLPRRLLDFLRRLFRRNN